jgi:hypothetical protein
MGYCTYGGKPVPGNNQASCIGGGGNWVGGETGPDTQVSMPPIGSPIQLPNIDIGRPPIRPEPDRGIPGYQAPQISQSPERMWDNTDDFGNRLNANFAGDTNFGLLRDRAVDKNNTQEYNTPFAGPVSRETSSDPRLYMMANGKTRPMQENEMAAEDRYNVGQKFKSLVGLDDESKARKSASSRTPAGMAISSNPYGGDGPVMGRKVINSIDDIPTPTTNTPTTTKNKKNGGLLVDGLTGDDIKKEAKKGKIPTSMWDKMQTKGYWLDGVEGGSGKWDNRLFRLGEMMAHMGTPLSKQGDSPSKRWTTANTAANTLKASANKAKKTPTPLKIDNIGSYITKKMDDDAGAGFFNWGGMSNDEIEGASDIINTNITKKVRAGELALGEGKIDIKKIADEEIAKYLKSIGQ